MFLAHAGLHLNPHPSEPVLYLAIGCAVVALIAIGVIRWLRRPSDKHFDIAGRPIDLFTFSVKK
jgi:hypothetical protein